MLTVKITGHSSDRIDGILQSEWYTPNIGTHQTYDVFDFDETHFKTAYVVDPYKDFLLIKKEHCELIR